MSSFSIGIIILTCVFGGVLLGMLLRNALPGHHLTKESQDAIKLGTGLISTMAALVLGLLVGSAKSSYDRQDAEITEMSANFVRLDRLLSVYGPETRAVRERLRQAVTASIDRIWAADRVDPTTTAPTTAAGEALYEALLELKPTNDAQRKLQSQSEGVLADIARTRMLLNQQARGSISSPLLIVLVFWLSMIFLSFGLFAPGNATVIVTLFVGALSVSGALFLILEMYRPFSGLIRISEAPVRHALMILGK